MALRVWCSECGAQSVALRVWHSECGTQSVVLRVWHSECGAQSVALRVWRSECGTQSVALRVWRSECGAQSVALRVWHSECGALTCTRLVGGKKKTARAVTDTPHVKPHRSRKGGPKGSRIGLPEPCVYTVYDRIFGDSPAQNTVYTPYIYMVLANPTHKRFLLLDCPDTKRGG